MTKPTGRPPGRPKGAKSKPKSPVVEAAAKPQDAKPKVGRPSSYDPAFCARAKALCEAGALDTDLAQAFGIALSTLYAWRATFPEFSKATTRGKEVADDALRAARRAGAVPVEGVINRVSGGQNLK